MRSLCAHSHTHTWRTCVWFIYGAPNCANNSVRGANANLRRRVAIKCDVFAVMMCHRIAQLGGGSVHTSPSHHICAHRFECVSTREWCAFTKQTRALIAKTYMYNIYIHDLYIVWSVRCWWIFYCVLGGEGQPKRHKMLCVLGCAPNRATFKYLFVISLLLCGFCVLLLIFRFAFAHHHVCIYTHSRSCNARLFACGIQRAGSWAFQCIAASSSSKILTRTYICMHSTYVYVCTPARWL